MTFPTRYELLDSSGVDWGGKEKENKTWQQKIFDTHDHVTVDHCHMKGQKTACFSAQSNSTLSETILLFLRPLSSSSWSNPQLVRFPRPTPRRWLLKSGGDPVQLSTNNWTPSLLRQRCNQWAPSSREERCVLIIKEQTCNRATKSQGKGQEDWQRKRENLYL